MPKLITFSCFMLFWVFYEMSGGTDFEPRERVVVSQAPFVQPASRNLSYQRPINAPQVVSASYVPVSTEPLVAINATAIPTPDTPETTLNQIVPIPTAEPEADPARPVLWYVVGSRVNLRQGPGTNHQVIDTLPQGTSAEVIAMNDDGWAQIRLTESQQTGWMAARLLSEG